MNPKLIEPAVGAERTREISIPREEFLIGRGSDCDLRVNDEDVSRHHCLIRVRGQEATLSDLGSSNGTFVNGKRVLSQVALVSGDEIRLAKCRFLVDLGDKPEGFFKMPAATDPLAETRKINPKDRKP
ncbi:MAG TPA: FHA domain-containing protein [Gemmataceae bacterium]|jgi:pSer/pThr/pTyr-binding forkhead associated (FHA) protein|nr:FHA domain-containing protein [Gemmataceae bacterium]